MKFHRLARAVLGLFYLLLIVGLVGGPLPGVWEAVTADYPADLDQPLPPRARAQYRYLQRHLQEPFAGKYTRAEIVGAPFAVVALSQMACGLFNTALADPSLRDEIVPLLHETVRRALAPGVSRYRSDPRTVADFGDENLYLSHLNLILGCDRAVSGDEQYDAFAARVSRHLAARSLRDGDYHAQSFAIPYKWPADQAVTLCSLYLYDRLHGTALAADPIAGWLRYLRERGADPATGLPVSSLSPAFAHAAAPRGCALSWTCLYLAQFAPEEAAALYHRYRELYFKAILGTGGFREWPPGEDHGWNFDAGPVVFEIGTAASGLGVGPTRLFRDYPNHALLMRTAALVGMAHHPGAERQYRLAPLLGEAILFHGATARRWFGGPPAEKYPRTAPVPVGPFLLLLLLLGLLFLAAWRLYRLWIPAAGVPECKQHLSPGLP